MIPQWDELFDRLGARDYPAMLGVLEAAWKECFRALVPGGLMTVVIGDALRSDAGGFRLWPNHAETLVAAARLGFQPLPYVLWKKPTNKPNAFLGSGFLPPNAYVTLDCEFVLVFRKGGLRRFPVHDKDVIFVADAQVVPIYNFFNTLGTLSGPITSTVSTCLYFKTC